MKILIDAHSDNDNKQDAYLVESPQFCPHCSVGIKPHHLYSYTTEKNEMFSCFLCPICEKVFMAMYDMGFDTYNSPYEIYPAAVHAESFAAIIQELSPNFCKIYNESLEAEQRGLKSICGMGYRKALEFLIKDYAILCNREAEETIKRETLGNCIQNRIDNPKIQKLAKASAWIGNDETHYVRKHEDYDITHLKAFIQATVSFIEFELTAFQAAELVEPH